MANTTTPGTAALLRGKALLIFDFDGTVADTTPLHEAAFADVLRPLGVQVHYGTIAGMKTLDAIRSCAIAAGRSMDSETMSALASAKQRRVREMIGDGLRPLPGVDRFLHWARGHYRLAMVTSGSHGTVQIALRQLGYSDLFDPLICADDVKHAKPAADGFLLALAGTGMERDQALVFEDSDAGFEAARAAQIDCVDARTFDWDSAPLLTEKRT